MGLQFSPAGVVTITTDFGHRGPFIGTMKGVMLRRAPGLTLVDLTHETHVHWPVEAGFWLRRSYGYFPKGTVHLAVVDPGVGTERSVLVVVGDGHAFVGPDNGLLAEVIEVLDAVIFKVDETALAGIALENVSSTFHGRDIFAPLAAAIAAGQVRIDSLGDPTQDYVPSLIESPEVSDRQIRGVVITSDNFGNLITNINGDSIARLGHAEVHAAGHRIPLGRTYADASPGDLLALINSYGVLEIACSEQSAIEALGIGRGAPITVTKSEA